MKKGTGPRAGLGKEVRDTVSRRAAVSLFALALLVVPAALCVADDFASKKLYQLKFEQDRVHRVTLGREPEIETYWFLPFTLTNEDAEDHSFFLDVSATSDKNVTYRNLEHAQVKELARRRLGVRKDGRLWSAADLTTGHEPTDIGAPFPRKLDLPVIKAGESVRCVAIFRGPDPEADRITVTVRGLSNDVVIATTDKPNERKLVERALELSYERPGDEFYRSSDAIEYLGRQWVTLERVVKTDLD